MLAAITAALTMLCGAATAQAEGMVRRIHEATISLVSLDRQMVGRLARAVVPDFMYLEYKSLYLELKPSVAAASAAPPGAARSASAPYQNGQDARCPSKAATVEDIQRAVEEVKLAVGKAKREIIKDAHTTRTSEADRRVPKGERARQIGNVRKIVREARAAGKRMSILRACRKAWQDVKGGYPSPEALYDYCHSHRAEF